MLEGNQASDGGAVSVTSSGASAPALLLFSLSLSGNFASGVKSGLGNGGAVLASGVSFLGIDCCSFVNNRARVDGGSCWVSQSGLSVSSTAVSNSSTGSSGGGFLVADTSANVTVALSTITNNLAQDGGAIFLRNCSGSVTLSQLLLEGNMAMQGNGGAVGMLYVSGLVRLQHSTLSRNKAFGNGAAVYISTVLEAGQDPQYEPGWVQPNYVQPSLPTGNVIPYLIQNCSVLSNTALFGNGSVALSGQVRIALSATQFAGNQALSGGALWCRQNVSVNVSGSSFQDNTASFGGAAHVQDSCRLGLAGSDLVSNRATTCGGALCLNSTQPLYASGLLHATSNSADKSGGAVCVLLQSNASLPQCHPNLGLYGGMIALLPNSLFKFELNTASGQGGAIFLSCVKPGSATMRIWSSQNLNLSSAPGSRRVVQSFSPVRAERDQDTSELHAQSPGTALAPVRRQMVGSSDAVPPFGQRHRA